MGNHRLTSLIEARQRRNLAYGLLCVEKIFILCFGMDKEDFVMCVKETTASKESNSKDSKLPVLAKNLKTDISMGVKVIGQSFEESEKTLKEAGYSDSRSVS